MTVGLFRKKPVVIEAVRLNWSTWSEMCDFVGVGPDTDQPSGCYVDEKGNATQDFPGLPAEIGLLIPTLEGTMLARDGDWVIKGIQGEFYPCRSDIFEATYEPIERIT